MKLIILIFILLASCTTRLPKVGSTKIPAAPIEKKDCESPLGVIEDGERAEGYLNESEAFGRSCQKGYLVCHDGVWTGEHVHKHCAPGPGAP